MLGGANMFAMNRCARFLACVAMFGMVTAPVFGASPISVKTNQSQAPSVFDVQTAQGHLVGQVVKSTGVAEAGVEVTLLSSKNVLGKTKTNEHGQFAIPVSKTGVYQVAVGDRSFFVRAWQPEIAPPKAKTSLLCVTQDVVRGQCGGCGSLGACGCGAPAPIVAGPACGLPADPSCGLAGPSCGVAGPSCGVAGPSCGLAGPTCGAAGPTCGAPGLCGLGGGGGGVGSLLANPMVIGLGVAAAIAIPLALDDDDDDNGGANNGAGGAGEPAS